MARFEQSQCLVSECSSYSTQICVFLKNGPSPASFLLIFSLFKQTSLQFLQQMYVKNCPSSIRYWESNPRPSERESLPIITRHICYMRIVFCVNMLLFPLKLTHKMPEIIHNSLAIMYLQRSKFYQK